MLLVKGKQQDYVVELEAGVDKKNSVNDLPFKWDLCQIKEGAYHALIDGKSYNLEVIKANFEEKEFEIKVNGRIYPLTARDQNDLLLEKMGMNSMQAQKVSVVKAPMPGLVLDISVEPGAEVKKGDALLVLEAMKMENILKSPTDGVVKSIQATKGAAVEKNEILLNFE